MKIFSFLLELFFPPTHQEKLVENLTAQELLTHKITHHRNRYEPLIFFSYKDPLIREMLLELKFHSRKEFAHLIAEAIYDDLFRELKVSTDEKVLLIPIPLSVKRLRERGYNQVECIAEALIAIDDGRLFRLETTTLEKSKDTPAQTSLSKRSAREENIRGVFVVRNKDRIQNQTVVLLDDVLTTGATLREAVKTLTETGAKTVLPVAIAH